MRNFCVISLCLIVSSFAFGQDSRADLFGGYSYLNIDTNGLTSSRQNANGWEASISGNFNKCFAAEADVAGYYKNYSGVSVTAYSYGAGPRFNFKPIFVHALIGGDHLTGSASGLSASQDSLAGAFGGGVQWKVSGPFSVRASADYVFTRHNILGGPSVTQNNVRASVGIVYSFVRTEHVTASPRQSNPMAPSAGMKVPALGVMVRVGANPGAEITDEAPNSVAALAGLHPGDVINAIDGKPVSTPMELAAALANRPADDKVRIGFLIRGQWQKETVLLLGNH
jgi:membrane-associated protease RseP (regulator of RpoE activity)